MSARKGPWARLTGMGTPPKPGTAAFAVWKRITALNTWIYRVSGGRLGGSFDGAPALLLHHVGRRSGEPRVTPLLYLRDGDAFVIVASWGGAPKHPAWYHNLMAAPETHVEIRGRREPVRAESAGPDERERLWPRLLELYGGFETYQGRTAREIPVVMLRPR